MELGINNSRAYFYLSVSRLVGIVIYAFTQIANDSLTDVRGILLLIIGVFTFFQIQKFAENSFVSRYGVIQICIDVFLLTLLSIQFKNINAFAIYMLVIACSSLIMSAHATIIVSACAGICFTYQSTFNLNETVSIYEVCLSYFSLIGCALISSFYASRLALLHSRIEEKEQEIAQVSQDKQHLIESFSEGIITLDIHSAITGINQAAKTILGLSDSIDPVPIDLKTLLDKSLLINKKEVLMLLSGQSTQVHALKNDKQINIHCSLQDIKSDFGDSIGRVLFISDNPEIVEDLSVSIDHENIVSYVKSFENAQKANATLHRNIIGESSLLKELLLVVEQAAPSDAPVLVLGESGTGKELISRTIHSLSMRSDKPFIAINCGAIPDNLLESELFGYKKGAFTGADRDHDGLFLQANEGTLFLDEVGELPLHLQVKLLRVLQEGTVRPLGSHKELKVNVRIIAATNKNLKELVAHNIFREDLYYRLRVIELVVPPLRSRKTDIPALVYHFLSSLGVVIDQTIISADVWECLLKYDYPGNIRELENIIHRAKVLGGGSIRIEYFPEEVKNYKKTAIQYADSATQSIIVPANLESILENIEVSYLLTALQQAKGVKKDAAKLLGLNFRSFRYRLKKYNLSEDEELEAHVS